MRITGIETLRLGEFPNLLFVSVHTDAGLSGLGETMFAATTVEAHLHDAVAPYLLGQDPLLIERHASALRPYVGYAGSGAEQRARSAIDIALWDIHGKAAGEPLHRLLGGASRDAIPVYNTCAGRDYMRVKPRQAVENWGLAEGEEQRPYEDLGAFLSDAGALAADLVAEGFFGMKIWPFDPHAEASGGARLSAADLERTLGSLHRIRAAVGTRIEILVEMHALWDVPTATRIVRALEEFNPYWIEDPVRADCPGGLAAVARSTLTPIAAGETVGGQRAFQRLLDERAMSVVIVDLGWAGGITEARRIGTLADAYGLPMTVHDCSGPVAFAAASHLAIHLPNVPVQEMVRAYLHGWYPDLVTSLPVVEAGSLRPPEGPGIGTTLRPELRERSDATVRLTGISTSESP